MDRRQGMWSWLTNWLATGSVAVGVAALIVTLAVMSGFRHDIQNKILGIQPHILVSGPDGRLDPSDPDLVRAIESNPDVAAWSPYVSGQILVGRGKNSSGAVLKGVDPEREPRVSRLEGRVLRGEWADLGRTGAERPTLFLGVELARQINARVGDRLWVVTPASIEITAMAPPRAHLFEVGGFVQTGLYDYDSSLAYASLDAARNLFDFGSDASGIGLRLRDLDRAETVASDLRVAVAGRYWIQSWLSLNRNLFSALKLEKTVMFIILTLVTVVASFMIVSNLLLIITQKVKEIGILRAMGATAGLVRRVFLLQGVLMGVLGNAFGVVIGVALAKILSKTNFIRLPADVYYIDRVPVDIQIGDIAAVVAAATFIITLASLYPAHRAAKLDPLEAIRYG